MSGFKNGAKVGQNKLTKKYRVLHQVNDKLQE